MVRRKSFRERFLTKRNLIILAAAVSIAGAGGAAVLRVGENPSFCTSCHIIKPYYESWNEGSLLDHKHAQQDVNCRECHSRSILDKAQEGFNYMIGNYTLPLESETGGRDFCLECHSEEGAGTGWDEIKAATNYERYNPHDSHEGEQKCNLCHKMHQPSQFVCTQCHSLSWTDGLDESWECSR